MKNDTTVKEYEPLSGGDQVCLLHISSSARKIYGIKKGDIVTVVVQHGNDVWVSHPKALYQLRVRRKHLELLFKC